jgi:hypothetical protein
VALGWRLGGARAWTAPPRNRAVLREKGADLLQSENFLIDLSNYRAYIHSEMITAQLIIQTRDLSKSAPKIVFL